MTAEDLPLDREDEVGRLAFAFDGMTRALADNIQKLVESTAASQRMQGELNAARDIQIGILPPADAAPDDPRCRIGAFLSPAKEVGGDLYDFFAVPDGRQELVIGDVSDKGVPAALFMSMTVTLVRCALAQGLGCAQAMRQINNLLAANNPSCLFVTLFIGLFEPETGVLEYANGAHCQPFVVGGSRSVPLRRLEETSGPLVGAMPDMEYKPCRTTLGRGEYCFLYTDGVSEAMNSSLEMFGEERLGRVLAELRGLEPDKVVKKVFEAVEGFREEYPQSDDITMLCVRRA